MPNLSPVLDGVRRLLQLAEQQQAAVAAGDDDRLLHIVQERSRIQAELEGYGPNFSRCRPSPGQLEDLARLVEQLAAADRQLENMIASALEKVRAGQHSLERYQQGMSGYSKAQLSEFSTEPRFFNKLS